MLDLDYGSQQPQQPPQFCAASVDDLSYIDDDRGQYSDLLTLAALRRWDFPVFELSDRCPDTLLSRVRPARLIKAKFHYTGPTGPARTFSRDPGRRPGSPTKSADFVWSGPVGPV